jgi:hypothetical protein
MTRARTHCWLGSALGLLLLTLLPSTVPRGLAPAPVAPGLPPGIAPGSPDAGAATESGLERPDSPKTGVVVGILVAKAVSLGHEGDVLTAPDRFTATDVHAALEHATARARCIVRAEVGGRGYDPYAVGSQGERGPAQLHPRGLLSLYLRWSGGAEPENPYVAIPFLDWALTQGYARHWSPVVLQLCEGGMG